MIEKKSLELTLPIILCQLDIGRDKVMKWNTRSTHWKLLNFDLGKTSLVRLLQNSNLNIILFERETLLVWFRSLRTCDGPLVLVLSQVSNFLFGWKKRLTKFWDVNLLLQFSSIIVRWLITPRQKTELPRCPEKGLCRMPEQFECCNLKNAETCFFYYALVFINIFLNEGVPLVRSWCNCWHFF